MTDDPVGVRPATVADVPLILDFLRKKAEFDGAADLVAATEERLRETLFGEPPQAHFLLAEQGGRAVGFASYYYTYSTFLARRGIWLDDLYVDADRRGRGIGGALLSSLARLARAEGCGRLEWTAAVTNERGLAFYRAKGATISERTRLCRLDARAIDRLASVDVALGMTDGR